MKRSQSAKAKRFSQTIVNNISEAYTWLKSLPGGLGLEKCSRVFESRGFVTPSSLKHLRPGNIDAFFPSPEKLLLAEKHVLKSEIKGMIDPESRIIIYRYGHRNFLRGSIVIAILGRTIMFLLLTKRRHEISHCCRTFYRQQQLPATLRSVQLLAVRRLTHWIERGMK